MLRYILLFLVSVACVAGALLSVIRNVARETLALEYAVAGDKESPDSLRLRCQREGGIVCRVEVNICDCESHLDGLMFAGGDEVISQNTNGRQEPGKLIPGRAVAESNVLTAKSLVVGVTLDEDGVIQLDQSLAYLLSFLVPQNGPVHCILFNTFGLPHDSRLGDSVFEGDEFFHEKHAPEE